MNRKTKCLVVRVDEHIYMRLKEICKGNRAGLSTVVRAFISKVLDEIIDEKGYLKPGSNGKADTE